ncbi:MAG: AsmA family protein [Hyphomicrobiales bacterium]|nr:AsmA family protein [Hyphomicrobiales bacterium]
MQTTLLALAIAVIVALVSALVAPLVVDWSRYRSHFEEEASRLTGLTVHVDGGIDARILPTPLLKLHDVVVGEPGRPPQVRADFVELEIGLGPLLRGEVRATQMHVVAPQVNLGLDSSGAIDWPALSPTFRPDALAISHFRVDDGRITLADAKSGVRTVLQKFSFEGDVLSAAGPFHGEGSFAVGDEPYQYRVSGSHGDEGGGLKVKLGIDPSNIPLTTEVEGTLRFAGGIPQFDGTLALTGPAGATLARGRRVLSDPWQLAGKIRATPTAASLRDLAMQYGPDERALNLTGKAELTFGAHPHLDGSVAAVTLDVDRMLAAPDVTHRPPLVMLKSFLQTFVGAVHPPLPVAVTVAVDALTVGGATIQSLHGGMRFDEQGWSVGDFAFRAPGLTDVNVSGRLGDGPQGLVFNGPAGVQSADLKTLLAWLEGRGDQPSASNETLNAHGKLAVGSGRFALDELSVALDRENVEGRLAYTWADAGRPAALDGELHATKLNVDAVVAFVKAAAADKALEIPHNVALLLNVGRATFAGVDMRAVDARLTFNSGTLQIDRLAIGDLAGAAVGIGGSIGELSSHPRGRLTLTIDAKTLVGLTDVAGKFTPQVANAVRPFVDRLGPAKIHGSLAVDPAATGDTAVKLELGGDLGALRLTLEGSATGAWAHPEAAVIHVSGRFDADDGAAVVRLLDLDRAVAVDQLPGQMTISADGPLNGDVQVGGLATAGGFSAAATGTLHLSGRQAPTGSLQLKATAADLRPLHRALIGQPGSAAPSSLSAIVGIAGGDLSVTDLVVTVDKSSARARLDIKLSDPIAISGDVAANDVNASPVLALLLGLPSPPADSGQTWSAAPFGPGVSAAFKGDITFKVDRVALTDALAVHRLNGTLHLQPPQIELRGLDGGLAGGRLTGSLSFQRQAQKLGAQGRLSLAGAQAAMLVIGGRNAIDGKVTLKLEGEALGLNPEGLVGSFHGSGSIAVSNAQFGGIAPQAFDLAIRAADQSGATDAARIAPVVSAVMAKGRLAVSDGGAEMTVDAGRIRLARTALAAENGDELAFEGVADLNKSSLDARMTLSEQPPASALIDARPEIALTVKGALAAPERRLDLSALVGWLTLRATEQQTRRVESLEANRRPGVLDPVTRPASPAIRYLPPGTASEMSKPAGVPPPSAGRGFDRLRPDPSAGKLSAPRASNADKAAAAASRPASPATHSPLDLLFRSQN